MKNNVFFKKIASVFTAGVFLFLIIPATVSGQEESTGAMRGVVYKKDVKTPLKNFRVVLTTIEKDKKKEKKYESQPTDDNGNYELNNIPADVYKVGLVKKSGSNPTKTLAVVKIQAGKILERSFFYKPRKPLLAYINCVLAVIFAGILLII